MISAKKVAEIAGTSRSTVQRALNDHPNVNGETRDRIKKIAESLGYKTNKTAKALVMRQKKIRYAVIFSAIDNPFYQRELLGINAAKEELAEYGIEVRAVFMKKICQDEQSRLIDELVADGVNGIVLVAVDGESVKRSINNGIEEGVQFLTMTSDIEATGRFCYVGWDHYRGGRVAGQIMQWLVPDGGKIAVFIGSRSFRAHVKRLDGFVDAFSAGRSKTDISEVLENQDDDQSAINIFEHFLQDHDVQGVFIAGAGVSGVCTALRKRGLDKIVKIVCFDRLEPHVDLCKSGDIEVIIDQQPYEQGYQAIKILNDYVMFNEVPDEYFFTDIDILTKENIE